METPKEDFTAAQIEAHSVVVHQQKSNLFRVIHADGVWSSVNLYRNIHLTFYSERYPIPQQIIFDVAADGNTTENVDKRVVKTDWFREMEVDVVLSLGAARQVYENLGRFIRSIEEN